MKYAQLVPSIIETFGGRVLARGGPFQVMEGTDRFARFIVIQFPSMAHAEACYRSKEYQEARLHRLDGAGEAEITLVEGGEYTSADSLASAASIAMRS
jgi:uncharacterized protein (DUF1330 family)